MTLAVVCVYTPATAHRGRGHARALRATGAAVEVAELDVGDADRATIRRLTAARPVTIAHGPAAMGTAALIARRPSLVILDLPAAPPARAVRIPSASLLRRLGALTAATPAAAAAAQDAFRLPVLPVVTGQDGEDGALLWELACRVASGRGTEAVGAIAAAARRARADDVLARARVTIGSGHPARAAASLVTEAAARGAAAAGRRDIAQAMLSGAWRRTGDAGLGLALERLMRADGAAADAILNEVAASGSVDPRHRAAAGIRLIARGDLEAGRRLAETLEATGTPDALAAGALLRSALGMREPAVSLARAASRLAPDTESVRATQVAVLERAGELDAALAAAEDSTLHAARLRVAGTLRAYDVGWLPRIGHQAPAPGPARGRILNLLEASLPHAPSGYAYRSRTIIDAQRRLGLRPVAATRLGFPAARGVRRFAPVEDVGGIAHHRFSLAGTRHYSALPLDLRVAVNAELVARLASVDPPDLIQAATPHLNGLIALAARAAAGSPVVYDVRGFPELTWAAEMDPAQGSELFGLRRAAETRCMREADAVTCLGQTMRAEIVSRGVAPERVHVLPHAVDVERFAAPGGEAALRARYALEDRFVVGYVSSLRDYEGVDVLLDAVAALRGTMPRTALMIVGDGPAAARLRARCSDLGIADQVVFTGRVPHTEVAAHYRMLDVFVTPRLDMALTRVVPPLKPVEAMAAGCCIAASDLPALRELLGDTGVVFPPGDAAALAERLVELSRDDDMRSALGRRAAARAATEYSTAGLDAALRRALPGQVP